jgi:serine/threonine protein kinase
MSVPPNQIIGKYEILEELGHGGFGTVFRVRNSGLRFVTRLFLIGFVVLQPEGKSNPMILFHTGFDILSRFQRGDHE